MDTLTKPEFPLLDEAAAKFGVTSFETLWTNVTLELPTSRRQMTQLRMYAGVVDEDVVELYAYSACARLAGAINEITGWDMLAVKTRKPYTITPPSIGAGQVLIHHLGVRTPGGLFLDVTGTRDDQPVLDTYSAGWIDPTNVAEMNAGKAYTGRWDTDMAGSSFREFTLYLAYTLVNRTLDQGRFSTI